MKKKLIVLLVLASSISVFASGFIVKIGTAANPKVAVDFDEGEIYDSTSDLTLELMGSMSDNMDIGAGIEFSSQLEKNGEELELGYLPVYINVKKRFGDPDATVFPYTLARAGFTFPVDYDKDDNTEADMGLHLGLGIGMEFNHFIIEMSGTYNGMKTESSDKAFEDGQTSFTKLTFSFGYRIGTDYGGRDEQPTIKRKPVRKEVTPTKVEEKPAQVETKTKTENKTETTSTENTEVNKEKDEVYDDLLDPEGEEELSKQKYIESKINELDQLKEQGIITEEEYQAEKQLILNEY
jgi:hypothetical protein